MRNIFCSALAVSLVLLTVIFAADSIAQDNGRTAVRVNGAGMSSDQVDSWAKRFMEKNPNVNIIVIGSSAGKGFQAILDGNADVAMMSRAIRGDEREKAGQKGIRLAEKNIGRAAIAVITHVRNPVSELSLEQLRKLYTGQFDNWKQVGGPDAPVRCLTRKIPESGGAVFFWSHVLDGEAFGKATVLTDTWGAILKVCETAQDFPLGIIPATRDLSKVKILAIKDNENSRAVKPSEDNIKRGTYPIVLKFSFAWDELSKNPAIVSFADFCQTQGGGDR